MKRSPMLVLVVLSLLLAGCFGGSSDGVGNISVTSDPSGARIFLDGEDTGKTTPALLEQVKTGSHQVTVALDGYVSQTRAVSVSRSATVAVSFNLDEDVPPIDPNAARVTGYVSESSGGPRVAGATV